MTNSKNGQATNKAAKNSPKTKKSPKSNGSSATKQAASKAAVKGAKGFQKGTSGNPKGRPPGSRNKATLAVESMLDGECEAITKKCLEMAKAGNPAAMRMVMDRIAPPRKARPILLELPYIQTASDLLDAYDAIIEAMAQGELTPDELGQELSLIDAKRKIIETVLLAERVEKIEEHLRIGD